MIKPPSDHSISIASIIFLTLMILCLATAAILYITDHGEPPPVPPYTAQPIQTPDDGLTTPRPTWRNWYEETHEPTPEPLHEMGPEEAQDMDRAMQQATQQANRPQELKQRQEEIAEIAELANLLGAKPSPSPTPTPTP